MGLLDLLPLLASSDSQWFEQKNLTDSIAMFSNVWCMVMSIIIQEKASFKKGGSLPVSTSTFGLSPRSSLVITVPPKTSEAKIGTLTAAGLVPRTNGRYQYYTGPSTDQSVKVAIAAGGTPDAFSPGESVSINGLVLFSIMSRILAHTFCLMGFLNPSIPDLSWEQVGDDEPPNWKPTTGYSEVYKITQANLDNQLPGKGFFFAYFDGLLLPDNGWTISRFITHFSPILGTTAPQIASAVRTFTSGWTSLRNTIAGREYSHMLFCLDMAMSNGILVRPVYLSGLYQGCVFESDTTLVCHGATLYAPSSTEELKQQIDKMRSHEGALQSIAETLSVCPFKDKTREIKPQDPDTFINARSVYLAIRDRVINPEARVQISEQLKRVRFDQQLWDVTNPKHVSAAVRHLVKKSQPDPAVPFNLRIDLVFSRDPILSVLGAFGNMAPSLRGSGQQIVKRVGPRSYQDITKPGRLTGIPIFAKSHNDAKEDWEGVLKDNTIFFDTKGKDKEGKLRVKNLSSIIPFDSDEAKGMLSALGDLSRKRIREEPEMEANGPTEGQLEQMAVAKRRKKADYSHLGLLFSESGAMDEDVEEEDPFA